jgi:hypothetical protein
MNEKSFRRTRSGRIMFLGFLNGRKPAYVSAEEKASVLNLFSHWILVAEV